MQLFSASLTDTVTLWWEQPDHAPADALYTVRMGGETVYTGDRTHCTVGGLNPGASYSFTLSMGGEQLAGTSCATLPTVRAHAVTDYGAVGDGATLNTAALQRAIDACGAGEEVVIPAGAYLTGGLRLHSHMRLKLEDGAVLQGSANPEDYLPMIPSRFEGIERMCYQSLLNLGSLDHTSGPNASDVLIYGAGTVAGGGWPLAQNIMEAEKKLSHTGEAGEKYENDLTVPGRARGRLINLSNCERVRVTGLTLRDGASWNVHMIYSRDIVTDHCEFRSRGIWNGDGWDPDSSERCTLFASHFYTEDDSVAIKSGKNPEGNVINRPTRCIRVFDCLSEYGLGIAIGSEMSGGVEDVRVWHCDLAHSLFGLQVKATRKRGGYVRDVVVRDCALSRFLVTAVPYNDDGEGSDTPPVLEGFRGERLSLTGWARSYDEAEEHDVPAIEVRGFSDPGYAAKNMIFTDCVLPAKGTVSLENCENVTVSVASAK